MDVSRQMALLPHYAAVAALTGILLVAIRAALGEIPLPVGLVSVAALVLAYPTLVRSLGLAPDVWEKG